MSQMENMAVPAVGNMSKEELLELKKAMNAKALAKRRTRTALRVTANVVFAVLILLPLLYAISIALMPSSELFTTELNLFPKNPTFSNFINAFRTVPLLRFILNSFIMAGCITIGQIITCSLAAFAFSFLEFKGKGILFMVVMATMMVPGEATIISNYLTVSSWGMLDTYQVLIVPYLTSAMGIFLFRQFYMTFPISLYESAKLDGCSNLKFIVRILLPLTKSAIGAMAVYTFINAWNMYMWPLLVTGSNNMRTVQIGISMLDSVDSQSITLMIAGVVMIIIPSISIFIVGQKQLIRGMFSGAVQLKQAAKAAQTADALLGHRTGNVLLHQLHRAVTRRNVNAGGLVAFRIALFHGCYSPHFFSPLGRSFRCRSWISAVGWQAGLVAYSPVKQAVQKPQ